MRLAGGNNNCSGRVEILCNRAWGTVCDDSWDLNDASVVCRQLGCGSALEAARGAAFGQGNGTSWLDEVKCTGSESILFDCLSSSSAQSDCDHKEDASVICSGKCPTERCGLRLCDVVQPILDEYKSCFQMSFKPTMQIIVSLLPYLHQVQIYIPLHRPRLQVSLSNKYQSLLSEL